MKNTKALYTLLQGLNFVVAFMLLVVYLSPYVDPSTYWWMGAIAFLYPSLFFINVVFILIWLLKKKLLFALSFFMVLVGYRHFSRTVAMDIFPDKVAEGGEFKLTTYNVRNFDLFNLQENTEKEKAFRKFFMQQQPDVLCLQELFSLKSIHGYAYIDTLKQDLKYNYQYLHTQEEESRQYHGINILSKYPIIESAKIDFYEDAYSKNGSVYADIQFPGKIIRVYSVHLQSIQWGQGKDFKPVKGKEDISYKLSRAYSLRMQQLKVLQAHIANSPYPVVIAGDFNEPPLSYLCARLQIKNKLNDAFIESGLGWGSSINSNSSLTRIDHIYLDSALHANRFHIHSVDLSDHLPLSVSISYN